MARGRAKTSRPWCNGSRKTSPAAAAIPAKIYLMGHSAGASHVAGYVSHPEFYKVKDGGLAGAIMVSGIYQLDAEAVSDNERAYYGADPSVYAERSSLQGLLRQKCRS